LSEIYRKIEDYTTDELVEIVGTYATYYSYTITDDVKTYLLTELAEMKPASNGRFARDLVDLAIQNHSHRIIADDEKLSKEQLSQLALADFKKAF